MQPIDSAYITRSNVKNLSRFWLQPDGDISIDGIFHTIYDKDLSKILNRQDALSLYIQNRLINRQLDSLKVEKKFLNQKYIFSVAPPKYHKDPACKFLSADFKNYLVPPEIENLGREKVQEFKEYCESNRNELAEKTEDVFWARINIRFNVHVVPKPIHYLNSGIENIEGMSIEELQDSINKYVVEILGLLKGEEGRESEINKYKYAPSIKHAISKISDEKTRKDVEDFFKLKKALVDSLFELYRKQANIDKHILPVTLLKACGIEPCKACAS